jgi:triacylglycerol lipase
MIACAIKRHVCILLLGIPLIGISLLCAQDSGPLQRKQMPRVQTFDSLFQPDYSYPYLKYASTVPFQHQVQKFDRANAWWLAEISMLAYADADGFVKRQLRSAGMLGVKRYASPRDSVHHTQAILTFNADAVIIAFRGTEPNEWKDLKTDVKAHHVELASGGKVHAGFQSSLTGVWAQVQPEVERLSAEGRSVWLTGHSLGAALAVLAAHQYKKPATVYTFGAPRVGDAEFVKRYQQPTFRIVNNTDFVTEIPPPFLYHHVGELVYFDSRDKLRRNVSVSQILKDKARGQSQAVTQRFKEWANLDLDKRPFKPLLDHAPICYVVHCWNSLVDARERNTVGPGNR